MTELLIALAAFTVFHMVPSTPLRAWLIDRLGRGAFMWAFSGLSLLFFGWIWIAYRAAPVEIIFWVTPEWARWASAALMLAAIFLAIAAATGRPRVLLTAETALMEPDPVRGVMRITRHPMLWAVAIWGLLHMANNADPAAWVFFGYITVLALGGTYLIDRRRERLLGKAWRPLKAQTSNLPFLAIAQGRNRLILTEIGWSRFAATLGLWALVLFAHETAFGLPAIWF
ncbi:MAG: NnrU family protein [Alphaproteobacteria bacterium]